MQVVILLYNNIRRLFMLWSIMSFICYSSLIAGALGGSAMLIRDLKEDIENVREQKNIMGI